MHQWILPSLSEVFEHCDRAPETAFPSTVRGRPEKSADGERAGDRERAERSWRGAHGALGVLLQGEGSGIVLSGPIPWLSDPTLTGKEFATWLFTSDTFSHSPQLPPAALLAPDKDRKDACPTVIFPLLPNDPLRTEAFCLVLTASFSLVMVLGATQTGRFQFSFDPDVVKMAWNELRSRVFLTGNAEQRYQLDTYYQQFSPRAPDYKTVMQFCQLILNYLPQDHQFVQQSCREATQRTVSSLSTAHTPGPLRCHTTVNCHQPPLREIPQDPGQHPKDVELLQAIAHEVKTPLTTIRTFTRLLLKRRDLPDKVMKIIQAIDRECTEQIDRFDLIFRAVELEKSPAKVHLTATELSKVLDNSIPRWQKQACRRNVTLDVVLPQTMPVVVSDPTMLDQVLTGAIENFTSTLPTGSHVQVKVMPAGNQLKLQLQCQGRVSDKKTDTTKPTLKCLGQLLMFQPETGNLSLNISATKNLFQAIGGKLIVRQRPQQDWELTIFLPLN
ncbi:MAG: HAMP domain-containing histidine kinase [Hormoscilla sp. SP12CHS1]|nr:HAMP domain-containing histidine kinase [Hormoscilla sp. SP12CHS1]